MPRFKTEEGRQRWLAAMAKRRGKKSTGGGVSTAVTVPEPEVLTVRPRAVNGEAVGVLDAAIQELDRDREVLTRAKEILEVLTRAKEILERR